MLLNTRFHGVKEYNEEDIITFKKGIPGFENITKYIMFPLKDNEAFSILHSIEDETIGFVVVSPFYTMDDYEFELNDDCIKELRITDPSEVLVVNTVTLNSKAENITSNLQAPIIINIKSKLGEQIILTNEKYLIKHPLFKNNSLSRGDV